MDSLLQILLGQLSGDSLGAITNQLGVEEDTAQKAIGLALPLLIGSLNRNSSSADGAQALTSALTRDHDGSILADLAGNLMKPAVQEDGMAKCRKLDRQGYRPRLSSGHAVDGHAGAGGAWGSGQSAAREETRCSRCRLNAHTRARASRFHSAWYRPTAGHGRRWRCDRGNDQYRGDLVKQLPFEEEVISPHPEKSTSQPIGRLRLFYCQLS